MAIEIETANDLAVRLQEPGYHRIGIDGIAGCGKSTLAKDLSTSLELDLARFQKLPAVKAMSAAFLLLVRSPG